MDRIEYMMTYILEALRDKVATKTEIEAATGIDKSTLYRWQENRSIPRLQKLERIYQFIREKRKTQSSTSSLKYIIDLKSYRRSQGMTQLDIEELTGIAKTRISRYENGREVPDALTQIFLSKLANITPYVLTNNTGKQPKELQETVLNKLYELTPSKLAILEGFMGKLTSDDANLTHIEQSEQLLLKTSELIGVAFNSAVVEVDIDSFAPNIRIGDQLRISPIHEDRHSDMQGPMLSVVVYQNEQKQALVTIGELFRRVNDSDPSMCFAHIEQGDMGKSPLWIKWQNIIQLYRIETHTRRIT